MGGPHAALKNLGEKNKNAPCVSLLNFIFSLLHHKTTKNDTFSEPLSKNNRSYFFPGIFSEQLRAARFKQTAQSLAGFLTRPAVQRPLRAHIGQQLSFQQIEFICFSPRPANAATAAVKTVGANFIPVSPETVVWWRRFALS